MPLDYNAVRYNRMRYNRAFYNAPVILIEIIYGGAEATVVVSSDGGGIKRAFSVPAESVVRIIAEGGGLKRAFGVEAEGVIFIIVEGGGMNKEDIPIATLASTKVDETVRLHFS